MATNDNGTLQQPTLEQRLASFLTHFVTGYMLGRGHQVVQLSFKELPGLGLTLLVLAEVPETMYQARTEDGRLDLQSASLEEFCTSLTNWLASQMVQQ